MGALKSLFWWVAASLVLARCGGAAAQATQNPAVASKRWAVAVLLTTKPSLKRDGWLARSVKSTRHDTSPAVACGGATACAVLVLQSTFARYSGLAADADFVALLDKPAPAALRASFEANGVVVAEMDFGPFTVFEEYLLMRKFYVLALFAYEKVLLLDSDTIVVGSLRHLFESDAACGRELRSGATGAAACWPERDTLSACSPRGAPALVVAQQTAGTPVLTAFMLVRPDRAAWRRLAQALTERCAGDAVCDRRSVYARGWRPPSSTTASNASSAGGPRAWALRREASTADDAAARRKRRPREGWPSMGAGFTDQGFAEHFLAQSERTLYSVSHRTCKLKYVHFNMPPKPWFCPGPHCKTSSGADRYEATDLRWGGHKCAKDWWWQFALANPTIQRPKGSCAETCMQRLEHAHHHRAATFADATFANYTPVCKDWSAAWPPLNPKTRPDQDHTQKP